MSVTSQWHYAESYMAWLYYVSHHVMTPDASRHPFRHALKEILENEQVKEDYAIDMCRTLAKNIA